MAQFPIVIGGDPVDVSSVGSPRTFILSALMSLQVQLEVSLDGVNFVPISNIGAERTLTLTQTFTYVRARLVSGDATDAVLEMGASLPAPTVNTLAVPASGAGAARDFGSQGAQRTLIYAGGDAADRFVIEASQNGTEASWAPAFGISGTGAVHEFYLDARYMRAVRVAGAGTGTLRVSTLPIEDAPTGPAGGILHGDYPNPDAIQQLAATSTVPVRAVGTQVATLQGVQDLDGPLDPGSYGAGIATRAQDGADGEDATAGGDGGAGFVSAGDGGDGTAAAAAGPGGDAALIAGAGGADNGGGGEIGGNAVVAVRGGTDANRTATVLIGVPDYPLPDGNPSGMPSAIVLGTAANAARSPGGLTLSRALSTLVSPYGADSASAAAAEPGTELALRAGNGGANTDTGNGGTGGRLVLEAGDGGGTEQASPGPGGAVQIIAGAGADGSLVQPGGEGGDITLTAGNAGGDGGGGGAQGGSIHLLAGDSSVNQPPGEVVVRARLVTPPDFLNASQNILADGTQITLTKSAIKFLRATGGARILTATPTIPSGQDGERLVVINRDAANAITLQGNSVVPGSGLLLGNAGSRALAAGGGNITLVFSADLAAWVETAYSGTVQ